MYVLQLVELSPLVYYPGTRRYYPTVFPGPVTTRWGTVKTYCCITQGNLTRYAGTRLFVIFVSPVRYPLRYLLETLHVHGLKKVCQGLQHPHLHCRRHGEGYRNGDP